MAKRRKVVKDMEVPPLIAIGVAVLSILVSLAFWLGIASIAEIHTRDDAKHINTTVLSWKESVSRTPRRKSMLITCSDGNMYEIRRELYRRCKDEVQSALSTGAEVTIFTGSILKDIFELSINGETVIPFEEGYKDLKVDYIGYAVLAAFLDITGISFMIYGIVGLKRNRVWRQG